MGVLEYPTQPAVSPIVGMPKLHAQQAWQGVSAPQDAGMLFPRRRDIND